VKLLGLLSLVLAVVIAHKLVVIVAVFVVAVLLAVLSRVPIRSLAVRAWIAVLLFTGIIALPALFITRGDVVARVPLFGWPITMQGLRSAGFLIARAETAATLCVLLVLCTPWAHVLKALRALRMPVVLVVIFGMTYRYIFVLLETARDMFESRRSRTMGTLPAADRRRIAGATAGVLMSKSLQLSQDVYLAMQSRGYTGEVRLLDDFQLRPRDYVMLAMLLTVSACAVWFGR
jgi:cobalt ECF transporter T component CbiQ